MKSNCFALCLLAALVSGCQKSPPPVVAAEGIVLLDGKPLPGAQVQFVPDLADFGAEWNSSGETDENGRFQLMCGPKPGAVVAKHWVLITEGAVPAELRGGSEEAQIKLAEYQAKLVNRPIPEEYGSVVKTPLIVEVTRDRKTYELQLTRSK